MREHHNETKAELAAREESLASTRAFGESLVASGHFAAEDIGQRLDELEQEHTRVHTAWATLNEDIADSLQLRIYLRDTAQFTGWMQLQAETLAACDPGDTLDSIEAFRKLRSDMQKSLTAQRKTLDALVARCAQAVAAGKKDAAVFEERCAEIRQQYSDLEAHTNDCGHDIQDALALHNLSRDIIEAEQFIATKTVFATDGAWNEPDNLAVKTKKMEVCDGGTPALCTTLLLTQDALSSNRRLKLSSRPTTTRSLALSPTAT